jgi:hypothetical protein
MLLDGGNFALMFEVPTRLGNWTKAEPRRVRIWTSCVENNAISSCDVLRSGGWREREKHMAKTDTSQCFDKSSSPCWTRSDESQATTNPMDREPKRNGLLTSFFVYILDSLITMTIMFQFVLRVCIRAETRGWPRSSASLAL